jgi:triacylglycerol esterase/lipase EstA (alpha/beta hydrolase family)
MNQPALVRRLLLAAMVGSSLLAGCAVPSNTATTWPTIVFVPGNTAGAQAWQVQLWRFESIGWPRDGLHVVHMPYPQARDEDTKPQEGRSSTADAMRDLAAEVDKALAVTGARQVVLVGGSRGGNTIRNYIINGGGAGKVSHAILGGTPSHGVRNQPTVRVDGEFNCASPFLTG